MPTENSQADAILTTAALPAQTGASATDSKSLEPKLNKYLPENMKTFQLIFDKKMLIYLFSLYFIALTVLFIVLYTNNAPLNQDILDYTQCRQIAGPSFSSLPSLISSNSGILRWRFNASSNICTFQFEITRTLKRRVHMYVRITNFYQNHQYYVKSADYGQLAGNIYRNAADLPSASSSGTTECGFLLYANCSTARNFKFKSTLMTHAEHNPDCRLNNSLSPLLINASPTAQYYPCGLVANSMFSDDISNLTCIGSAQGCPVPNYEFKEAGIAWPEDRTLFARSKWATSPDSGLIPTTLIPPPAWRKAWPEKYGAGYTAATLPDLATMERLHVWMRKAGLPTFRKLWGLNLEQDLNAGTWEVSIRDTWDCIRFGGTKSLVFADIGILGHASNFLWAVTLSFALLTLFFLVFVLAYHPRKQGDLDAVSWLKKEQ